MSLYLKLKKQTVHIEEDSHNQRLVNKIKRTIHDMIDLKERPRENYSVYLSIKLDLNYTYLANVFSSAIGITIEHYIIDKKIEKAMQLLEKGDAVMDVTKILAYSSMGHFSNQFKKVTGVSPSAYLKQLNTKIKGSSN